MEQTKFLGLYLTRQLLKSCDRTDCRLERCKAMNIIYNVRFTSKNADKVLKELEELGFIEIVSQRTIKINKSKVEEFSEWF
jgi:predicted transcriptional regulator